MRILVANRGEIARRILKTAHRLGHETVAVYADPDRDEPFVREATEAIRIGPAPLAESYLNVERLLEAARITGATAVHPGYGFLSESAGFAAAVQAASLVWIGPHPEAIERMGSKIEARALAEAAGVATIPGYDDSQAPADLEAAAARIGFPVLVKAAAGGGGKGIRIVQQPEAFAAALAEATTEAERNFGDPAVIVERYVEKARHIEVQIVGDQQGHTIDLGTRECSVQRRYQKLLEEAPAPNLLPETESGLRAAAKKLAEAIGYDSAGTVEFVVDDATGAFFFLEMNTRLQVEHPVTEAITGLDLVALQIGCAAGDPLPLSQGEVRFEGHAFEVRINAEDAEHDFAPQIGQVELLRVPEDVRWESGVEVGSHVTPHYDPMVAKLIVAGADRPRALGRLTSVLDEMMIGGLRTNTGFHRWLVGQPEVIEGRVTTRFLEEHAYPPPAFEAAVQEEEAAAAAALAWRLRPREESASAAENAAGAWAGLGAFRVVPHTQSLPVFAESIGGCVYEVVPDLDLAAGTDADPSRAEAWCTPTHLIRMEAGRRSGTPVEIDVAARRVYVQQFGQTHRFGMRTRSEHWAPAAGAGVGDETDAIRAPFPGVVTETPGAPGQRVSAGEVLVVIEAMKMLHSLSARGPGQVEQVHVAAGDSVDGGQLLVSFVQEDQTASDSASDSSSEAAADATES